MKDLRSEEKQYIKSNQKNLASNAQIINKAIKLHSIGNLLEAAKYYQYLINKGLEDQRVFSNFGLILVEFGKLKEAEYVIRKAIELNPNYALGYSNLGGILLSLGKLREAEYAIRKAIELNPNESDLYSNLGNILGNLGKFEEAEVTTRKAIELNPNFANAHFNLGNILINFKRLSEAKLSFKKAIKINPNLVEAHRDLGICLYLLKDIDGALKSIIKANNLDNKNRTNKLLLLIFQKEKSLKNRNPKKNSLASSIEIPNLDTNFISFKLPVNKKLIKLLCKIKARNQEIYQFPTFGDAKGSDYKLFERSDLIIDQLKKQLIEIARNNLKSDILISDSFFTIFKSGGGLISHDHLNRIDKIEGLNISKKKFSLVYYLSVGDQNCDEPGILKLENPNQKILPYDGLIIIFPAGRKHSVFYKGKKNRIIIGVNFYTI